MPASYTQEWKSIKAGFEISSKRKKPSEKLLGVFRKGTGLEPAFAALDRAIEKEELDEGKKALATASKAADAYQKTLIKAAAAEKEREVQKDISNMMTELFKLVERAEKEVAEVGKIPTLKSLSDFSKVMRSKAGDRLAARAKKEYNQEAILFLEAMAKKDYSEKTYKDFIMENGKYQINIAGALRTAFDPKDLKRGPWKDVVDEVLRLLNSDVIARANRDAAA